MTINLNLRELQKERARFDYTFRLSPSRTSRCFDCLHADDRRMRNGGADCNLLTIVIADSMKSRCPLWTAVISSPTEES